MNKRSTTYGELIDNAAKSRTVTITYRETKDLPRKKKKRLRRIVIKRLSGEDWKNYVISPGTSVLETLQGQLINPNTDDTSK